ncbi:MAG TPA: hypothetical protein VFU15_11810 [Bacteroidia bacterium]|nr:hypothetical protein [Bacteroidia bacterium]
MNGIKALFCVLAAVAISSCGSDTSSSSQQSPVAGTDAGNTKDTAVIPDTVQVTEIPKFDSVVDVGFTFLFTRAYCGGAAPPKEVLDKLNTPQALSLSTLILENKKTGNKIEVTTDANGKTEMNIPAGRYILRFSDKINPALPTGFNPKCETWLKMKVTEMNIVPSGHVDKTVSITFECDPCDASAKMRP